MREPPGSLAAHLRARNGAPWIPVTIAAVGQESVGGAKQMVQAITVEPEVGAIYEGPVKSTTAFGAFVEIMPGSEGLVHISELQHGRTENTEDVVKKGDRVRVKVIERDERGRLRLSMKALIPKPGSDGAAVEPAYADAADGAPSGAPSGAPAGESTGGSEERPRREGGDRGGRGGGRGGRGGRGR